jgi:hypothetical protein
MTKSIEHNLYETPSLHNICMIIKNIVAVYCKETNISHYCSNIITSCNKKYEENI